MKGIGMMRRRDMVLAPISGLTGQFTSATGKTMWPQAMAN